MSDYNYTTIINLTQDEVNENPVFKGFYDLVAQKLGLLDPEKPDENHQYIYDCRNINIAANIQTACYEYFEARGVNSSSISMQLCLSGPKVDENLKDNQVGICEGYAERAMTAKCKCNMCGKEFDVAYYESGYAEADDKESCFCDDYSPVGLYPSIDEWKKVIGLRGKTAVITSYSTPDNIPLGRCGEKCTVLETLPEGGSDMFSDGLLVCVKFADGSEGTLHVSEFEALGTPENIAS